MKETKNALAVVVDEYGGMVGIVTMNDLIEQLVGEFNNEPDDEASPEPYVENMGEGVWALHGNIQLSDLAEDTEIDCESDDFETFTGLVYDALGKIPDDGEQAIDVELEKMFVHISRVENHQIVEATITEKVEEPEEEKDEKDSKDSKEIKDSNDIKEIKEKAKTKS